MSDVVKRLEALGHTIPTLAAPVAVYVPTMRTGNLIFTSGQLPLVDGQLMGTGKVGAGVTPEAAHEMAARCALNAIAAIRADIGNLDRVARVVKVVGFVASDPGFTGQPAVINGASELLGAAFGEVGAHARSAVGVTVLPMDAPVEVEVVVEIT
jgi:enamine deaminase RidA (YjgF/YER057c/UK114 family)